ncbi:MAG: hypothetical protein CME62_15215 [Halobacteriovoraceae bacterium]|nr:hypothetical protein [Halobacteriovoraceae bacterium]|tara:strand:- start:16428 stop:17135 length:708 start_codon:yes stop_codon:yes gene_type:complete
MKKFLINSIYLATEGEGAHIGKPQIFVRFQGCAIGCINCDSKETWDFSGPELELSEVLTQIEKLAQREHGRVNRISITGGDPLHPKHSDQVELLAGELKKKNFYINIEASGSRVVDKVFDIVDFVSFDFKTPSTGVKTPLRNLQKMTEQYQSKTQIKSVISDKKDFEFIFDIYSNMSDEVKANLNWVITPCFEPHEEFPRERFIQILELNQSYGAPFRFIGQQHKWIYGPEKKDV